MKPTSASTTTSTVRPSHLSVVEDGYEGPRSAPKAGADDRAILLYNGDCAVCRKISSWVIGSDEPSHGGRQAIDERPIGHDPDALKKIHPDLDIWEVYEKVHVVLPDGTIKKGGEAVAEVLKRLPSTSLIGKAADVSIFGWRPVQTAINAGYFVLDRVRPALGCESCGTGVPWWGKPLEWTVKLVKAIRGDKPSAEPAPDDSTASP